MTTDSATANGDRTWVISLPAVQLSIRRLIQRRSHPFFLGYVHLRQQAVKTNQENYISADWSALGRVLEVPGAPPKKPYLKPFQTMPNRLDEHQWWNSNIPGSWAPSSLRQGMNPLEVISVNADKTYNLRDGHPSLTLEHLLYKHPMSALDFATFMLRDYGLLSPARPGPDDLIANFRLEYGVMSNDEFNTVYENDASATTGIEWFEPLPTGAAA